MQDPTIIDQTPARRPRRTYTREFKIDAVAQCERGDRSLAQVAMDLKINANLVRRWQREQRRYWNLILTANSDISLVNSDKRMHCPISNLTWSAAALFGPSTIMNMPTKNLLLVTTVSLVQVACGGGGGGSSTSASIEAALDGVWRSDCAFNIDDADYQQDTLNIDQTEFTLTQSTFNDQSCTQKEQDTVIAGSF